MSSSLWGGSEVTPVHCHGWWQTHGSSLHQRRFSVAVYKAKQVGSSPGLRGLSSLTSCGVFLCAKGIMICDHLLQIPWSPEFLTDIFWIRLSLLQLCSLLVKAGKGTEREKVQTVPSRQQHLSWGVSLEIGHGWGWIVLWSLLPCELWQQHIPGEPCANDYFASEKIFIFSYFLLFAVAEWEHP